MTKRRSLLRDFRFGRMDEHFRERAYKRCSLLIQAICTVRLDVIRDLGLPLQTIGAWTCRHALLGEFLVCLHTVVAYLAACPLAMVYMHVICRSFKQQLLCSLQRELLELEARARRHEQLMLCRVLCPGKVITPTQ